MFVAEEQGDECLEEPEQDFRRATWRFWDDVAETQEASTLKESDYFRNSMMRFFRLFLSFPCTHITRVGERHSPVQCLKRNKNST